jgi:hypothetical protein
MKIEQHISQLLYRYQCVTVPGFGAFLTEIQPAEINESSNAFYPPKKRISFNGLLRHNDGLLANHIAQSERTSYDEAVESIRSEVGIWNEILGINDKFTLKNIGELRLNAERSVVFTPYDQFNYLKDAFGLNSFVSPQIKREAMHEAVTAIEEKAPIIFTPEARRSRPYLKYTAILVLALGVAGTIGYKVLEKQAQQDTLAVREEVQKEIQQKIQEATFFIETPMPAVTLTVKDDIMPFHVVAGAFRNEFNAQKTFERLSQMGYKAKRLPVNKHGLHPVAYGSYPTYREASKAWWQIRKYHPEAWVLVQEF